MQLELIKKGLSETDVEPERIWVVPSALREKWTLRQFAECFEGVPTPIEGRKMEAEKDEEDEDGEGKSMRKWAGDDVKRVLLATVDDDSTVVYYVVHDGIVKPRQN
jgi:tRNA-splicing endonuclease subunit Sen15